MLALSARGQHPERYLGPRTGPVRPGGIEPTGSVVDTTAAVDGPTQGEFVGVLEIAANRKP